MAKKIRLSQCMIVKNEEKNIERALTWGKDIVCEQIVVDTGSTDRTVEIAERMGAKVYHFEWIDDFSAAKNFAIEQASGDWIAFLDADEYIDAKHVHLIHPMLERANQLTKERGKLHCILRLPLWNLDDNGKVLTVSVQDRFFCNLPWLRYQNRVHETLHATEPGQAIAAYQPATDAVIYHTGYTTQEYAEKQKKERNIRMLEREVKENPQNGNNWAYLADMYLTAERWKEAEDAAKRAIALPKEQIDLPLRMMAATDLLKIYYNNPSMKNAFEVIYQNFCENANEAVDLEYWMALFCMKYQRYAEAIQHWDTCLFHLEKGHSIGNFYAAQNLEAIYQNLAQCYIKCKQKQKAVTYATAVLKTNRWNEGCLNILLYLFVEAKEQNSTIYAFLEKLYDFQDPKDAYCVAKAAKEVGNIALAELALSKLPQTESHWSRALEQTRTLWAHEADRFPALPCQNGIDLEVSRILGYLQEHTADEIREHILQCYTTMQEKHPEQAEKYTALYDKVSYWGKLEPDFWEVGTRKNCANYLKEHWADILWLYGRLGDYRSKQVLYAILRNWLELDATQSLEVKQNGKKYYDLDLLPAYQNGVAVDVGAYIGNTVKSFVSTYGETYEKIYCYEPDPENAQRLEMKLTGLQNLCIRSVGVGKKAGTAICNHDAKSPHATTLELLEEGEFRENMVSVVTLDEDITEDITYLKINVCGMEEDVLMGAAKQIQKNHPFIAADAFYGYAALTALARRIDAICPGYTFYLRHFGENLVMTDFVLYAVYQKN